MSNRINTQEIMQLAVNAMFWGALVGGIAAVSAGVATVAGATGAVATAAKPIVKSLFPERQPVRYVRYEEDEGEDYYE